MSGETKTIFIDTNGFLQVRDLKDLPWKQLFPSVRAIDVMVAPRVIEELDNHKTSTNQRRRDRARLALHLIENASRAPDLALVLREAPICLRIVISTAPRFDWSTHPVLDPAKPDDQLVAEALSFGNGAEIFSHDSGPRIRARVANMQAYEPPPEWLLPVEQTDDQRKIRKLERELAQALSRHPKIVAGFDHIDEMTRKILAIQPILQPLDPDVVERLVSRYVEMNPCASSPSSPESGLYVSAILAREAERYRAAYSSFVSEVREYYSGFHELVGRIGTAVEVPYFVKNDGGVTASGLRIEFSLEGRAFLLADREDAAKFVGYFEMPKPPEKPHSIAGILNRSLLPQIPPVYDGMKARDPVAFWWVNRPTIVSKNSALQCQEFRATREHRSRIIVLPAPDCSDDLRLHLHASATNMLAPINVSATVVLSRQQVEWSDPVVQRILPKSIRDLLR